MFECIVNIFYESIVFVVCAMENTGAIQRISRVVGEVDYILRASPHVCQIIHVTQDDELALSLYLTDRGVNSEELLSYCGFL